MRANALRHLLAALPLRLSLSGLVLGCLIFWLGFRQAETRAIEPDTDPASGDAVRLIIRDSRGMELRVFAYSDLRDSGVPVIMLDRYEMDQVLSW